MEFNDIKELSSADLKKKKTALVKELFDAKIKNSIGQLSNPLTIRSLRRDIAKINTALVRKISR